MSCKLGHSVGRVVKTEATITRGALDASNVMTIPMIPGERNRGMNGMNAAVMEYNWSILRFGNKGSLIVRSCRTQNMSKDRMP